MVPFPSYPCALCSPACVHGSAFALSINSRQIVFWIDTFIDVEQNDFQTVVVAAAARVFLLVRWWCKVKTKIMSTRIHDHPVPWFMIDFVWFGLPVYFTCCSVFLFLFFSLFHHQPYSTQFFSSFHFSFTILDVIWIDSNSRTRTHTFLQSKLTI